MAADIHQLALQDSTIPRSANLAAILFVGENERVIELVRAYELLSADWVGRQRRYQTKLFATLDEARDWLQAELGIANVE